MPNVAIPDNLTPESMLEIMLHTMKETLLEYFKAAEECIARGEEVSASNTSFIKALNVMKRPEKIRLEKLQEMGLDDDDENHPDSLYMLAVQKYNSGNVGGVKAKVEKINKKMSSALSEMITGKVNVDNIVEKKMEVERFVNDFFDPEEEVVEVKDDTVQEMMSPEAIIEEVDEEDDEKKPDELEDDLVVKEVQEEDVQEGEEEAQQQEVEQEEAQEEVQEGAEEEAQEEATDIAAEGETQAQPEPEGENAEDEAEEDN